MVIGEAGDSGADAPFPIPWKTTEHIEHTEHTDKY